MRITSPRLARLSRVHTLGTVLASCVNPITQFQLLNPYKCLYSYQDRQQLGFNRWSGPVYRLGITSCVHGYLAYYWQYNTVIKPR